MRLNWDGAQPICKPRARVYYMSDARAMRKQNLAIHKNTHTHSLAYKHIRTPVAREKNTSNRERVDALILMLMFVMRQTGKRVYFPHQFLLPCSHTNRIYTAPNPRRRTAHPYTIYSISPRSHLTHAEPAQTHTQRWNRMCAAENFSRVHARASHTRITCTRTDKRRPIFTHAVCLRAAAHGSHRTHTHTHRACIYDKYK